MNLTLDQWAARNLGFLSILPAAIGIICMPSLLLLPFYILPIFPSLGIRGYLAAALVLIGLFLVIQYWRYPHRIFNLDKRAFWLTSIVYIPCWFVLFLPDFRFSSLSDEDLSLWPLGIAILLFPVAHFILSVIGAISVLHNTAEQGAAANP
jgi:hypothetical protein